MESPWKPDWEEARQRVEAWWQGELLDRPCIRITAPLKPSAPQPPELISPADEERFWTDPEFIIPRWENYLPRVWYGGEAFPIVAPAPGRFPIVTAAFLGSPVSFQGTATAWCGPIIEDWDHCPDLRFDPDNKWLRIDEALLHAAGRNARGRYLVSMPDLNGPGEVLARLRSSEKLAADLIERPEKVHEMMMKISGLWFEYWKHLTKIVHQYVESYTFWMDIWSDTPATDLQCDFSIMISNEMFREFFLPHIAQQTEWIGRSIYHLDGPGALRHLDSLLELPKLSGIQWCPGAGAPPMSQWIPVLKRIRDAGKLAFIECTTKEVPTILSALRPEGIFFAIRAESVAEGQEAIRYLERHTVRG